MLALMIRPSWLLLVSALVACQQEKPAAPLDGGVQVHGGAYYVLTAGKLDSYLAYQRALLGIHEALFRELGKLPAAGDGGLPSAAKSSVSEVLEAVDHQAKAEQLAREQAGLSEGEIDSLSPMILAVASKRSLYRTLDYAGMRKQLESVRAELPETEREGVDRSLLELEERRARLDQLSEEKKRYGEANVELLLTHEAELVKNWELLLSQRWGRR